MNIKDIIREGQYWRTRDSEEVKIIFVDENKNGYMGKYVILGSDEESRTIEGKWSGDSEVLSGWDLMEKITAIYVAGGMSGYIDLNYPAFNAETALLRSQGFHVENPAENPDPYGKDWQCYMRKAIAQLIRCDRIHLLEGWSKSRGAKVEYTLAQGMGLEITFQNEKAANEQIEK